MNISFIRNTTGILDLETLGGILGRFQDFCSLSLLDEDEESWKLFWKPVGYSDFMDVMGVKIEYKGEMCELVHPYYLDFDRKVDKMFGPECASAKSAARFGLWAPPVDLPYPVDSDTKIRIALKGKESWDHVLMSYNQIAGLCSNGRDRHWSEDGQFWGIDPLYRQTPDGEPKVPDLIKKGSIVQSNYSDTVYIVSGITRYEFHPEERPKDHIFETWSLSLIDRRTGKGGFTINKLVAVGGKIQKLFMANDDEVCILGNAEVVPIPIMEEDESYESCVMDYKEEEVKTSEPTKQNEEPLIIKGVQLSLF